MNLKNTKILLTGSKGTLGKALLPILKEKGAKVDAPSRKELDVQDILGVLESAQMGEYNIIIHAAAWTDVPGSELRENQEEVMNTNVLGSSNVAYAATKTETKVVYISTDYVYEGTKGNYEASDLPAPKTFYGFSKLAGESFFSEEDLIIRTSFAKRGLWGVKKNQYGKAFVDSFTSKDWVDVIAELIVDVIVEEKTGIVNVGTSRKSLYDLAIEEFPEVEKVSFKDAALNYEYPQDSSLKSSI